jgi:lipopolysaccharide export system protein LptA
MLMSKFLRTVAVALLVTFIQHRAWSECKEMQIEADNLNVNTDEQVGSFIGNVVAMYDDIELNADEMNVYYISQKGGERGVDKIVISGHVKVRTPKEQATGERGIYNVKKQELYLYDNVIMQQGDSTIEGDKFYYNNATKEAIIQARKGSSDGNNKRTRAIIKAKDSNGEQINSK